MYEKSFNAKERARIEAFSAADRRFLNGVDGPLDPSMQPSAASGRGGKHRLSAEYLKYEHLGSRLLKGCCRALSEMMLGKSERHVALCHVAVPRDSNATCSAAAS